jgi:DNA-binding MarR family transcriptional regulator
LAADPADRRGRLIRLTPDGDAVLARSVPIWERTHAAIESCLPDGNADRLRADLVSLAQP